MNPNPDSVVIMRAIDDMPAGFRMLAYEFGAGIVAKMIAEGWNDPEKAREVLQTRRQRRQEEQLR